MLALLLAWCVPAGAAAPGAWQKFNQPWFDNVGVAQGLRDPVTTAVAQDAKGLVWIGTLTGLVRWDGYRAMPVFGAGSTVKGLDDTYVRALLPLPDNSLLIGTNSGGLVCFEPATDALREYPVDAAAGIDGKVYALASDHAGGAWVAMDQGLFHYDVAADSLTRVATGADTPKRNFSVLEDDAGNLWLGNNDGLLVRRAGSADFVKVVDSTPALSPAARSVLAGKVWALAEDREHRIWVGSVQSGAAYLTPDGQWHAVSGFSAADPEARFSTVRALQEVDGKMWLATDGSGILVFDPTIGSSRWMRHDTGRPSSLPGDVVRDLMLDRTGSVWAATELGATYHDARPRAAFAILPATAQATGLANGNVRSLFTDSAGREWVGLGAGKLDVIDAVRGTIRHLHLTGSQTRRDVLSFAEDPDGTMWVGALGLVSIDPATFAMRESILPQLDNMPVISILRDGDALLLGTYDGVYRYDTKTGAVVHFTHRSSDPRSLADSTVRGIVRVGNNIWYLTSHGISIARDGHQTDGFRTLRHTTGQPGSLPQDTVNAAIVDAHGRVWIATMDGLGMWDPRHDPDQPHWRHFDTNTGLPSNRVDTVQLDADGNVWASTSLGIARVDATTLHIAPLSTADGAHLAGTYTRPATARARDGTLLFGSLGGLSVIRPDAITRPDSNAPLLVTRAIIDGQEVPYGQLPSAQRPVALQRSRSLRIGFALLDFQASAATQYAYRLVGFDDSWNQVPAGTRPVALYTNLPHGNFQLELRAVTAGLVPHTVTTAVPVEVAPRWYETWAAKFGAALALVLLVGLLIHLRTAFLRRRAADLQRQIDRHTADLTAANARLAHLAHTDELTGAMNRRRCMALAQEVCSREAERPAAIALFDLDHFKLINDQHGHLAGDATLRFVVDTIHRHCRGQDHLGRFGGEEFVLCLPNTSSADATAVCERIRGELAAGQVEFEGTSIPITTSVGVAALRRGESLNAWLSRADEALYAAKSGGRNRIVTAAD